ncbi:hypothetical protein GNF85_13735 [Clostridium perfringens]
MSKRTNLKITSGEWIILNNNIECNNARAKAASVLNFLKKCIEANEGTFSKALAKIHILYSRSHFKFTLTHFKNIINRLKDLGLLIIEKIKNRNVYTLPKEKKSNINIKNYALINKNINYNNFTVTKKVTKKVTEKKSNETTDIAKFEVNEKKHRYMDLYDINNLHITYNDIINYLKNSYKGIKKSFDIATKKELKEIAKVLFVANNVNSNSKRDKYIQHLVLNKIKFSLKKIRFSGAVSYIETILFEKMIEVDSGDREIPDWIADETKVKARPTNFTQRNYSKKDFKEMEKEWLEYQWSNTSLV